MGNTDDKMLNAIVAKAKSLTPKDAIKLLYGSMKQ